MKNKIDIVKIIMREFSEKPLSKRHNKLQEECDVVNERLQETFNRKQNKLFYQLEEVQGALIANREDELIEFVLDFIAAYFH